MTRPPLAPALAVLAALLWLASGCERGSRPQAGSTAPKADAPKPDGVSSLTAVPCVLDTTQPGPMRRVGKASIQLHGGGLSVDAHVGALCGPLFNRDVAALGIEAGEGLLFEACVTEGYLQLTSRGRKAGAQHMHAGESEVDSTDVSFNVVGGATFSSHGLPTDRVTLSDDMWKADAELALRDVAESGAEIKARFSLDCSAAPL